MPKKLKYLAVCLLVLLNVVSTMGGSNDDYKYYNSAYNNALCLSFKNKKLIDCCKQDDMQRIYVHKTGPSTGIFHIKDYKKVLCYDKTKHKFKLYRRKNLGLERCRHQRRREREQRLGGRPYTGCTLTNAEEEKLKRKGCELYENFGAGYAYISFKKKSHFLRLRRGRVQRHKRLRGKRDRGRESKSRSFIGKRFLLMNEKNFVSPNTCRA